MLEFAYRKLIMISKEAVPVYINMEYEPYRGILVNNESKLIIGGGDGSMSKYSLNNPTASALISNIKLKENVWSIIKTSKDMLLCG